MTITMRLSRVLTASVLAASVGLATGLAATPAGANPAAPVGPTELCLSPPCEPHHPDDLANPTEDPDDGGETNPTEEPDPGQPSADVPIPANANFTG